MPKPLLAAALLSTIATAEPATGTAPRLRLTPAERTPLQATYRDRCPSIEQESVWAAKDWVFPFPDGTALVLLGCNAGAYNPSTLVLMRDSAGRFAVVDLPALAVQTAPQPSEGVVHTTVLQTTPAAPQHTVVYPRFDPKTGVLQATSLGRGQADARTDIAWVWRPSERRFSLLYWMVDASTDGHFTPSCAAPVPSSSPCPGHENSVGDGYGAMVYAAYK